MSLSFSLRFVFSPFLVSLLFSLIFSIFLYFFSRALSLSLSLSHARLLSRSLVLSLSHVRPFDSNRPFLHFSRSLTGESPSQWTTDWVFLPNGLTRATSWYLVIHLLIICSTLPLIHFLTSEPISTILFCCVLEGNRDR